METQLELAERFVRQGEALVARQKRLVERLKMRGRPTARAEELLCTFEAHLAVHREHLDLMGRLCGN